MVKKSRIVLSMTRLIYLLLLLLCTPESSESKIAKFGCLFDDTDFNLKLIRPGKAKFREIDPKDTMYFADDESFNTFLKTITNTYSDFFETGLIYDSLSNYLRFYNTYVEVKHCPKFTDVSTFYTKYNDNYLEYEPGGNMITLMKKLVSQFPELEQSSYFVTRSTISNETLLNEVIKEKTDALPECFNHEQIAGIIKFQYSGNHYGYILLDPEIGAYKPVVFIEGEHTPYKYDGNNKNIKFGIPEPKNKLKSASQYITAKVDDGSNFMYLYYYRKPFCSMVETTMKPSLLKFTHSREKLNKKLVKVGSFTAHVGLADPKGFAKNSNGKVYNVEFKFLEEGNYEIINKFNLVELSSTGLSSQDFMEITNDRWKKLGTSQNNLIKDILLLQDIKNDKKFLEQCESTLKQLDKARSKESAVDNSEAIEKEGSSSFFHGLKKFFNCIKNNY